MAREFKGFENLIEFSLIFTKRTKTKFTVLNLKKILIGPQSLEIVQRSYHESTYLQSKSKKLANPLLASSSIFAASKTLQP